MKKVLLLLMMFALYACEQSAKAPEEPVSEETYSQSGTVLETIDVETYTYTRLDIQGREVWIASSRFAVSEGDVVRFYDEMLMKNFQSKELFM